jgi:hypothetical protein
MYNCTRVNLQDMYFEHVNAQNKILIVCIIFLVVSHELCNVSNSSTKLVHFNQYNDLTLIERDS